MSDSLMASVVMYEILQSIRLHPFLYKHEDLEQITEAESRKIDEALRKRRDRDG